MTMLGSAWNGSKPTTRAGVHAMFAVLLRSTLTLLPMRSVSMRVAVAVRWSIPT